MPIDRAVFISDYYGVIDIGFLRCTAFWTNVSDEHTASIYKTKNGVCIYLHVHTVLQARNEQHLH